MLQYRGHIAAGDHTADSAVDIWPKDLGIVLDAAVAKVYARNAGLTLPGTGD
ncbi:MAG: hypothetical protein ACTHJ3_15185 [Pararhizobium sp.]